MERRVLSGCARGRWLAALVGGVALLLAGVTPAGEAPSARSAAWSGLEFEAHKLLLSASTRVSVRLEPLVETGANLRPAPQGSAIAPSAAGVAVVSLDSDLPFGRGERVTTRVDRSTGGALQTERLTAGHKPSWKLQRYLSDGVFTWRASAGDDGEARQGHEGWGGRSERRVQWPAPAPAGLAVSDSYALLYLVSVYPFAAEGDELRVCVPAKDRLVEARFVAGEVITGHFDFQQVEGGQTRRRTGEVRARVVRGLGRALGSQASDADVDLGFLGMRGEITVLLEVGTGVPLEVRGRVQGIGKVVVRLKRVLLAPPTSPEVP